MDPAKAPAAGAPRPTAHDHAHGSLNGALRQVYDKDHYDLLNSYIGMRGKLTNDDVPGTTIPYNCEPPNYARRDPSNVRKVHHTGLEGKEDHMNAWQGKYGGAPNEPTVHRFKNRIYHAVGTRVLPDAEETDLYLAKPGKSVTLKKAHYLGDNYRNNPIADGYIEREALEHSPKAEKVKRPHPFEINQSANSSQRELMENERMTGVQHLWPSGNHEARKPDFRPAPNQQHKFNPKYQAMPPTEIGSDKGSPAR